jgi:hypothetical protein
MRLPRGNRSNATLQSFVCAEVEFPDYGRVLWAAGNGNYSRKTLRFQHLPYQESDSCVPELKVSVLESKE